MAGVTPEGFVRKTTQEILQDINNRQLGEVAATLDLSTEQPQGQINGIFADALGELWELAQAVFHGYDPDAAEDQQLGNLGKLTGTARRAASFSEVDLDCELQDGTELVSGTHFAAIDGNEDVRWTPLEDFTAPSDGTHPVRFRAENTGPINAGVGTITVIATSVVGWSSVTNPLAATPGRPVDSDATLRSRREESLTATGSATVDAVSADLLENDDVVSATTFENTGATVDADGRPPGSIEPVLYDAGLVANDDIAQIIWDSRAGGIRTHGSESGTATDANGDPHTVRFSRASAVSIWLEFDITVDGDYAGDAAFKDHITTEANKLNQDDDVIASFIRSLPFGVSGVVDVTGLRLGFAAGPTNEANLVITFREIARFDPSRIVVTTS